MDRKIRERRRLVSRQRGRRRAGLIFVFVLIIAGVVLFVWLRSSDVFAVKMVTATATEQVTQEDISRATADALGASLLSLSTGEIEQALLMLPYVRSAEVHRRFPNTLDVRVEEYQPVARLQVDSDAVWLVAENGRALEKANPPKGSDLPLLVVTGSESPVAGQEVPEVVRGALPLAVLLLSQEMREKLPAIEEVSVSSGGMAVVKLDGGTQLRLGDTTDLEHKLMVAAKIIHQYLRDGEQLEYIDVTVPDRVAVKAK